MSKDFSPQCGQTAVVLKLGGDRKNAFFPPLGGASIAPGYTPDAFAGAKPRHPPVPKGERRTEYREGNRQRYGGLGRVSACEPLCAISQEDSTPYT